MERLFTRAEAEGLLPTLTPLLEGLRAAVADLDAARARLAAIPTAGRGNGHAVEATTLEQTAAAALAAAQAALAEVECLGVEVKDPRTGLIDFRARREDRIVYLCWRLGEPTLAFWHELDAGFAGRERLDDE